MRKKTLFGGGSSPLEFVQLIFLLRYLIFVLGTILVQRVDQATGHVHRATNDGQNGQTVGRIRDPRVPGVFRHLDVQRGVRSGPEE